MNSEMITGCRHELYPHTHPPYNRQFHAHPLVVLTSGRAISQEEYDRFGADLAGVVMNVDGM